MTMPSDDDDLERSRKRAAEGETATHTEADARRIAQTIEPMLQFFAYAHLPPQLATVSAQFCTVAENIVAMLPRNPERTVALRKLLEAKDCAVRALLYKSE